ncbi:bZIP transcription factor 27-like [Vigna angularis]|nr:bZIP transcription factor 27-like [Vigna angularis]XP_052725228.1 bZIP transcription factor 27-like [Vigna angularis]
MTVHHRQRTKQCNQDQANLKSVSSFLFSHQCSKFVTFPFQIQPHFIFHQMLSSSSINTTTTTCNRNNLNHKPLSSSLPSHFSHQTPTTNNTTNNKAMEDVWDGINLTSLSGHNTNTTPTSKGANFQDFLARPFNSFTVDTSPVTALTLSTRSEYPPPQKDLQLVHTASKTEPFAHPFSNKRATPPSRDMRDARLMKNRESAARSRARKQENIASSTTLSFRVSPKSTVSGFLLNNDLCPFCFFCVGLLV